MFASTDARAESNWGLRSLSEAAENTLAHVGAADTAWPEMLRLPRLKHMSGILDVLPVRAIRAPMFGDLRLGRFDSISDFWHLKLAMPDGATKLPGLRGEFGLARRLSSFARAGFDWRVSRDRSIDETEIDSHLVGVYLHFDLP